MAAVPDTAGSEPAAQTGGRQAAALAALIRAGAKGSPSATATVLIDRFGSLGGVLDADPAGIDALLGDGGNCSRLIAAARATVIEALRKEVSASPSEIAVPPLHRYLVAQLGWRDREALLALYFAQSGELAGEDLFEGETQGVTARCRDILEGALRCRAVAVVIAHNHPGGSLKPSAQDGASTLIVRDALAVVGLHLADHVIVAGEATQSVRSLRPW